MVQKLLMRKTARLFTAAVAALALASCGKLSQTVDFDFEKPKAPIIHPPSSPFVGLQSAAGTRTSGSFQLEAGIGNTMPQAVQSTGGFKFYGGIQGQVFSK